MTIYTGTAYLFRLTVDPNREWNLEHADYRERVKTISGRHRFSYGFAGRKAKDVEGRPAPATCGFGFLPNLDAAKAFAGELKAEGVYDLGARVHTEYETTIYWPSMIPNAQDAYDPQSKQFKQGAFTVTRSAPDMSRMQQMVPYLTALKELYDRYGYKILYTGQKAMDVMGESVQTQIGIGRFPSLDQALACHADPAYEKVHELREGLFYAFELTVYGTMQDK